jgi:hypothetical protein
MAKEPDHSGLTSHLGALLPLPCHILANLASRPRFAAGAAAPSDLGRYYALATTAPSIGSLKVGLLSLLVDDSEIGPSRTSHRGWGV